MHVDVHPDLRKPARLEVRLVALALLGNARDAARRYQRPSDSDPESLHEFRLAIRRLRSWLQLWRDTLGDSVTRKDERRIRRIARATADARDLDVDIEWLRRRRHAARAKDRPAVNAVRKHLKARREDAHAVARKAASKLEARYGPLRRQLRTRNVHGAGADPREAPFGLALAAVIREASVAVQVALQAIHSHADNDAIHEARKAAKRLRYLLEPVADSVRGARATIVRLKSLQDLTGALHDACQLRREFERLDVEPTLRRHLGELLDSRGEIEFTVFEQRWLNGRAADFFARVQRVADRCARSGQVAP